MTVFEMKRRPYWLNALAFSFSAFMAITQAEQDHIGSAILFCVLAALNGTIFIGGLYRLAQHAAPRPPE